MQVTNGIIWISARQQIGLINWQILDALCSLEVEFHEVSLALLVDKLESVRAVSEKDKEN